jgi:CheY-like chemotaxis protein
MEKEQQVHVSFTIPPGMRCICTIPPVRTDSRPGLYSAISNPPLAETTAESMSHHYPLSDEGVKSAIRILIADDNTAMLEAIVRMVEHDFQVVGTVGDGQAVLQAADALEPDVLILDISMPIVDGIEAAHCLKDHGSRTKIVFLTVHEDPDFVSRSLEAGALGYVIKARLATDLVFATREALAGRSFVSPPVEHGA